MDKKELIRELDGYINSTELCKMANKRLDNYMRCKQVRYLIEKLCLKYNVTKDKIVDIHKGNSTKFNQGTWIHPDLGLNLAQWLSSDFSLKISEWINEWKQYKTENQEKFETELIHIKPSDQKNDKEKIIQKKLQMLLGGEIEVETPCGYIDLLTKDSVIEIKVFYNWKYALGQVLSYSNYYPNYKKVVYFFKECDEDEYDEELIKIIKDIYEQYNISIMFD